MDDQGPLMVKDPHERKDFFDSVRYENTWPPPFLTCEDCPGETCPYWDDNEECCGLNE